MESCIQQTLLTVTLYQRVTDRQTDRQRDIMLMTDAHRVMCYRMYKSIVNQGLESDLNRNLLISN